jgi:hypothetical protein
MPSKHVQQWSSCARRSRAREEKGSREKRKSTSVGLTVNASCPARQTMRSNQRRCIGANNRESRESRRREKDRDDEEEYVAGLAIGDACPTRRTV